ncbi:MAG: hypothetical protein P4L67_04605 [Candidatus Pacebacteria bacterium]|nr:hypothetical protein [Candidatus Paceibacterota bacterium]
MNENINYAAELRMIAGALRRKIQWPEEADILEAAAAEIERLKPKDLSDQEIANTLNNIEHGNVDDWRPHFGNFSSKNLYCSIDRIVAKAIAEKHWREKNTS